MADTIVNDPAVIFGGTTSTQGPGDEGIAAAIHDGLELPPLYQGAPPVVNGLQGDLLIAASAAGAPSDPPPGKTPAGFFCDSFAGQLYGRVHVIPSAFALGSVLSNQSRDFEVWNAHFETKNLSSIGTSGVDGITLNEPSAPPLVFQPLQSHFDPYSFTVDAEGPAIIDALYTFNFPSGESPTLTITGTRVVPLSLDYQRPFRERLSFVTNVIQARAGDEGRVRVRKSPRNAIQVQYEMPSDVVKRTTFLNQLYGTLGRPVGVPLFHWARPLQADLAPSATVILVDTTLADFRDTTAENAQSVMLWRDQDDFEVVQIDIGGLAAGQITTAQPIVGTHTAATTLVLPVREAVAKDPITWTEGQTNYIVASVSWLFSDVADLADQSSLTTMPFDGLPVLNDPNFMDDTLDQSLVGQYDFFDTASGEFFVSESRTKPMYTAFKGFHARTPASAWALRQVLSGFYGRQKSFWLPSFREDFVVAQTIDSADTNIEIADVGYVTQVNALGPWVGLQIELNDGMIFHRKILSATPSVSPGEETLEIDSSLGQIVTVAEIRRVSLMSLCRFSSDNYELFWNWTGDIEVRIPVAGVPA